MGHVQRAVVRLESDLEMIFVLTWTCLRFIDIVFALKNCSLSKYCEMWSWS